MNRTKYKMDNLIYTGDFTSFKDVMEAFDNHDTQDINILWAHYDREQYEGRAFVLFEKHGELFEVNAYHCSCRGLEHQWEPELTTPEALLQTLAYGIPELKLKEVLARYAASKQ